MSARMHMKSDGVHDGLVGGRHLIGAKSLLPKEFVDRLRRHGGQKLALRIGPSILAPRAQIQRSRRDERKQLIGVHGELIYVIAEFLIVSGQIGKEN